MGERSGLGTGAAYAAHPHDMNSDLPSGVYWRSAQADDAVALLKFIQLAAQAQNSTATTTLHDIEALFQNPYFNVEHDSRLMLLPTDSTETIIGAAWVLVNQNTAELWFQTHPHIEQTAQVEEALFAWCFVRGCQWLNASTNSDLSPSTHWLYGISWQDDHQRCNLFLHYGFYPLRFFAKMQQELAPLVNTPLIVPTLEPYISIVPFEITHSELVRQAYNEIFQEDWHYHYIDVDEWQRDYIGKHGFFPQLSFTAWCGEEMVGFSLNHVLGEYTPSLQSVSGHITAIGVKPTWRKRGIAKALLHTSLNAFIAAGLPLSTLDVDSDNPNEALGLYIKAGFIPLRMVVYFGKQV